MKEISDLPSADDVEEKGEEKEEKPAEEKKQQFVKVPSQITLRLEEDNPILPLLMAADGRIGFITLVPLQDPTQVGVPVPGVTVWALTNVPIEEAAKAGLSIPDSALEDAHKSNLVDGHGNKIH